MINRVLAFLLILPFALAVQADGQSPTRLELQPESRVWVEGTSNRDDWTVNAAEVAGFVSLVEGGGSLQVEEGRFDIPSAKMQGGRSAIMDRLMHGALKSSVHPTITYRFMSGSASADGAATYNVATKGELTLAGVTREIEGPVVAERLADGSIRFTGSHPLLMSEYEITPPTAMLGALRTGDRVVVHFELVARR
jgi:polyisoprenoid-binding protein YceI